MFRKFFSIIIVIGFFLAAAGTKQNLFAAGWFVGISGRYVMQNEDGADSRTGYGFQIGRKVFRYFDLALHGLFTNIENDTLGWTISLSDNFVLLSCNFYPPILPGIYVGGKFGMADRQATALLDANMSSVSANGIGYGIEVGYEYKILPSLSIGAGVNYLYAGEAKTTIEGDTVDIDITFGETSFTNIIVSIKPQF